MVEMEFYFDNSHFIWNVNSPGNQTLDSCVSEFDSLLQSRWKSAADDGVCRYRLTSLQTKVIPGKFGFGAQVCFLFFGVLMETTSDMEYYSRFS